MNFDDIDSNEELILAKVPDLPTKKVELSESEWRVLWDGLRHQREVNQLLRIRNWIQDECEQLM